MARIGVTFTIDGFHYWPEAHKQRFYLAEKHHHRFGFRVECAVTHDDREVEFHDLLALARAQYPNEPFDFGRRSCETIARDLGEALVAELRRPFLVTVDEDGIAYATVEVV